jgi:hypothetical protein
MKFLDGWFADWTFAILDGDIYMTIMRAVGSRGYISRSLSFIRSEIN